MNIDIEKFIVDGSKIKLNNVNFDELNWDNLIINEQHNFLEHLEKQAAGVAYYGFLLKQAKQQLRKVQKEKEDKMLEKVSQSMVVLQKMGKATRAQAEAMASMTYKSVFDKYDQEINKLSEQADLLQSYYNAWIQKGYVLNNMTNLINNGLIKI